MQIHYHIPLTRRHVYASCTIGKESGANKGDKGGGAVVFVSNVINNFHVKFFLIRIYVVCLLPC